MPERATDTKMRRSMLLGRRRRDRCELRRQLVAQAQLQKMAFSGPVSGGSRHAAPRLAEAVDDGMFSSVVGAARAAGGKSTD
jgi:hypothetical protein